MAPDLTAARVAVRSLLTALGEDPDREGLRDTPDRVARALAEMTAGRFSDPAAILGTQFTEACDEMVVVRGIRVSSTCEHHLLPFTGTATVGYVPADRVIGLSKLPRLVEAFARRLQVQERLTRQVAEALMDHLRPYGVGVVIEARHSCMGCRGVRQSDAVMATSSLLGSMRLDPRQRAEFLSHHHGG